MAMTQQEITAKALELAIQYASICGKPPGCEDPSEAFKKTVDPLVLHLKESIILAGKEKAKK